MQNLICTSLYVAFMILTPIVDADFEEHNLSPVKCSMGDHLNDNRNYASYVNSNHVSLEFQKRLAYNTYMVNEMIAQNIELRIPIRFIVFDGSDFDDTVSPSNDEIVEEVLFTEEAFNDAGLNVSLSIIAIDEYEDDKYYENYNGVNDDAQLFVSYGDPGVINVFYIPGAGQHANFPISIDPTNTPNDMKTVVLNADFINNGWSLMHELGHTFGLFHAWQGSSSSVSEEYVTRDSNDPNYNCHTHGDEVCDTPATLNLEWGTGSTTTKHGDFGEDDPADCDYNFVYTGNPVDPAGVALPMNSLVWSNAMNYGDRDCSRSFTSGQADRMWSFLPEVISYLDMSRSSHCLNQIPGFPPTYENTETFLDGWAFTGQIIERELLIESTQELHDQRQRTFYRSDDKVLLKPGFHAGSGVSFLATAQTVNCD